MPSRRLVGIIPAAGYASRLQPLRGSKEMIDIDGRPVVEFLMESLMRAGCEEIRVVTRSEKSDLARHAATNGATVILARPPSVSESLLAGMHDLTDDDVVLVGFPDTIWDPVDGFATLITGLIAPTEVVLGLFRVEPNADCDRVSVDDNGAVTRILVKPLVVESDLTWGCFVARAGVLRDLHAPEPGTYFDSLCGGERLAGVFLSDRYLDIGTHNGLHRIKAWLADGRR